MQLKDPLGKGEPEPGALGLLGMQGALLEGVEDALTVLGRYARASVGYLHDEVLTAYGGANVDASATVGPDAACDAGATVVGAAVTGAGVVGAVVGLPAELLHAATTAVSSTNAEKSERRM